MRRQENRVMIIGLDGGTLDVINPLAEMGYMPGLHRLMQIGVCGPLRSVTPPVTGPAWASFLTGKQPGRHGLFDFFKRVPGQVNRQPVNYTDIRAPTLLTLVGGRDDMAVCAFNIPITYPPPQINGIVIGGMLTPNTDVDFIWPQTLKKELEEKYGPYTLDVFWQRFSDQTAANFVRELIDYEAQKLAIARDLYHRRKWDLFMAVFTGNDRISHALWHVLVAIIEDRKLPANQEKLKPLVIQYFQLVDKHIADLVEAADKRVSVFLMSDHGFGNLGKKFLVNTWLYKQGWLNFDARRAAKIDSAMALRRAIKKTLTRVPILDWFLKKAYRFPMKGRLHSYRFLDMIDWERSKAYSASGTEQGIYINLKGREVQGTVAPGEEYESLRESIITALREILDPQDGQPIVSHICKREELYQGAYVGNAPDIVFFLRSGEYLAGTKLTSKLWEDVSWVTGRGTHRREGLFLACGQGFKRGITAEMDIIDLAPAVLFLLGLPIPEDMDGKVRPEIFDDEFFNARCLEFTTASSDATDEQIGFTKNEEQEILQRLEDLGYL